MADLYFGPEDVYLHALPRGAIVQAGVRVGAVQLPSTLEVHGHGFETGSTFTIAPDTGAESPAGLTNSTVYYAIRLDDSHVQAAASLVDAQDGLPVEFTDSGDVGRFSCVPSTQGILLAEIEAVCRMIDRYLPHDVPLTPPIPIEVVRAGCKVVAGSVLRILGLEMPTITAEADRVFEELPKIARGLRLRDANATPLTDLSMSVSLGDREDTVIP